MNKLLIVCSAVALIYGECTFANVEDFDEISESQELRKGDNTRDFGTKDQWQAFFESQGEPQQRFFLSKKEAEAIRKRKREKMDFLIKKLEALQTKDDISLLTDKLKKLKIENEDATGKLIDIDDEEELHHSKKVKSFETNQNDNHFSEVKSEKFRKTRNDGSKGLHEGEESLKPDASQNRRAKLNHLRS